MSTADPLSIVLLPLKRLSFPSHDGQWYSLSVLYLGGANTSVPSSYGVLHGLNDGSAGLLQMI